MGAVPWGVERCVLLWHGMPGGLLQTRASKDFATPGVFAAFADICLLCNWADERLGLLGQTDIERRAVLKSK